MSKTVKNGDLGFADVMRSDGDISRVFVELCRQNVSVAHLDLVRGESPIGVFDRHGCGFYGNKIRCFSLGFNCLGRGGFNGPLLFPAGCRHKKSRKYD